MKINPSKTDTEIEKAIMFLVDCVEKKCRNPKSLILHSIRVGLKLLEMKQSKEVIIAGIVHDLTEDTDCSIEQIKKQFGPKVAKLVLAMSQEKIADYKKRWHVLMKKIKKAGKSAMLLKLVDINENLTYIPSVKNKKELKIIQWKHNFAMNQLKPYLDHLKLFRDCRKNYKKNFQKLGI